MAAGRKTAIQSPAASAQMRRYEDEVPPGFVRKCAVEQIVLLLSIHMFQFTAWSRFDDFSVEIWSFFTKKHNVTQELHIHYAHSCTW